MNLFFIKDNRSAGVNLSSSFRWPLQEILSLNKTHQEKILISSDKNKLVREAKSKANKD